MIKKHWNRFVQAATAISTLIAGFVIPPPSAGEENVWIKFGKYVVAVCIGLWYVPSQWRGSKHHARGWWFVALALAASSVATTVSYTDHVDHWSRDYLGHGRVIIGETLTPDAQKDLERLRKDAPWMGPFDLLKASAGDPSKVWVQSELDYRQQRLTILYLVTVLLLASTIVTISQAADCATEKK